MTLPAWKERLEELRNDLEQVFGRRLRSVVAYDTHFGLETASPPAAAGDQAPHVHTLVIAESLSFADLTACASRTARWAKSGIATPLLMTEREFARSLDAFPLEFSAMALHHTLVAGTDPFRDVVIGHEDVRRACETQAKSHLIHLREGFLEAGGDSRRVGALVAASAPSFRTLLVNLARLDDVQAKSREAVAHHAAETIHVPVALIDEVLTLAHPEAVATTDPLRLYAAYLDAVERLAAFIDGWREP